MRSRGDAELDAAELDDVPVLQRQVGPGRNAATIHEGAPGAAQVAKRERAVGDVDLRLPSGHLAGRVCFLRCEVDPRLASQQIPEQHRPIGQRVPLAGVRAANDFQGPRFSMSLTRHVRLPTLAEEQLRTAQLDPIAVSQW